MKTEIGDKYKCIKSTTKNTVYGKPYFTKRRIYTCEEFGCLTDNEGNKEHGWGDLDDEFFEHFVKINNPTERSFEK